MNKQTNTTLKVKFGQNDRPLASDVKQKLADIVMSITWREIAHDYFGKSSSWLYHKLDGIDGNGGRGGFTESELDTLRYALNDLAERLKAAAERL
ncbi:MAG: DUF5053 domain-containing protein [Bacteroidales bacterium]|nr:DUF5053 domain-containing protein [Bacteroidales bacterium]